MCLPRCHVSLQVIIYNHALLALTAEDSLVLVADLDEYLTTPRPTTVRKVGGGAGGSRRGKGGGRRGGAGGGEVILASSWPRPVNVQREGGRWRGKVKLQVWGGEWPASPCSQWQWMGKVTYITIW